ncbi:transcriptional regulator GcvA [Glaciimonas sp. CA11.2]|uniref:transcriptional regulator GcvA n=1 Tax=unclassified Glaciimonas TaxID=2644401 RepID=UPI002AB4EA46|nr:MULTISPECIES: transcriptional regulator GcvA [unclassified Glaciimonas]MDY7546245.1 transcriptional regulator GcvA [Glaciimonas sp. CA11.2]MEB0010806.1 transcriptional regulator GcvA [Glaciimonas sp. Cout2]MEB0082058.1 transcriptional regulator GcvA [Glaciimonas sp. Gout2]MEB0163478.1 transcriptional regulator GcvA [Glaciimonas sp. CA11.2]
MADLRKLPPLSALRAFEAASRYDSFSRAAEEIRLTPGAISHQVRALEVELGLALFTRHGKRIAITDQGQRFATTIRKALTEIALAAEALKIDAKQKRLTISALPSFAARWLAPRLWKFIDLHPDTEVVLQSSSQLQDLAQEQIDVGIRFGVGHYPGLVVEKLMDDFYYPVVSPRYRQGHLPEKPEALAQCTLLRMDSEESWQPWFEAAGITLPEPSRGLRIQDASMLLRSASDGLGIALTRHAIALQEIAAGELIRLFDVVVLCPNAYYFACLPEAMNKPQVQAFHGWLTQEIAEFKAQNSWPG